MYPSASAKAKWWPCSARTALAESTLLRALSGTLPHHRGRVRRGSIEFEGHNLLGVSPVVAQESPWFPDAPSLTSILVPGLGHDLNAFSQATSAFLGANTWLQQKMPPA
jgi:hypothetical protein